MYCKQFRPQWTSPSIHFRATLLPHIHSRISKCPCKHSVSWHRRHSLTVSDMSKAWQMCMPQLQHRHIWRAIACMKLTERHNLMAPAVRSTARQKVLFRPIVASMCNEHLCAWHRQCTQCCLQVLHYLRNVHDICITADRFAHERCQRALHMTTSRFWSWGQDRHHKRGLTLC